MSKLGKRLIREAILAALTAAFFAASTPSEAATIIKTAPDTIDVIDKIVPGDVERLRNAVGDDRRKFTIILSSPGGDAGEAETMGDSIRNHGYKTYVAVECASAWMSVWAAGTPRKSHPYAWLGLHCARRGNDLEHCNADASRAQALYLIEMGVAPNIAWIPTKVGIEGTRIEPADVVTEEIQQQ